MASGERSLMWKDLKRHSSQENRTGSLKGNKNSYSEKAVIARGFPVLFLN